MRPFASTVRPASDSTAFPASMEHGPIRKTPKPVGQAGLCGVQVLGRDLIYLSSPWPVYGCDPTRSKTHGSTAQRLTHLLRPTTSYTVCLLPKTDDHWETHPTVTFSLPHRHAAWLCFPAHHQGTTHRYLEKAKNQQNLGRYARRLRKQSGVSERWSQLVL